MAGAKDFVREGLLDDVDGVVGMHVMPDLYAGSIGLKEGIKPHRMSCLLQPLFLPRRKKFTSQILHGNVNSNLRIAYISMLIYRARRV